MRLSDYLSHLHEEYPTNSVSDSKCIWLGLCITLFQGKIVTVTIFGKILGVQNNVRTFFSKILLSKIDIIFLAIKTIIIIVIDTQKYHIV